jgi:flagellar biosynthesis anti-sigma factor FlgM
MRVNFNHGAQPASETNRSGAQNHTEARQVASRGLAEDQAQLSGAHAQVGALTAQAAQLPDVRPERVQALRLAVQSGAYRASPEAVAGALVSHMIRTSV